MVLRRSMEGICRVFSLATLGGLGGLSRRDDGELR